MISAIRVSHAAGACAVLVAVLGGCSDSGGDALASRGRQIYLGQCIQCHNANPASAGPVGPAVKGASRELLEAKVLRGAYPPGYAPKRSTAIMAPMPGLAGSLDDLAAYLR